MGAGVSVDAEALLAGCRLVVFDVDGTLYRQGPVRRAMLGELLSDGPLRARPRRLLALRTFRRLREGAGASPRGFSGPLFERFCAETGLDDDAARRLVAEWMEERPLRHLPRAIVPGAGALFAALRARGVAVGAWSDYPARAKLDALGLRADHVACATDPDLDTLKPDPAGLFRVMAAAGCAPEETLMIGDRPDRDGEAARAAGARFCLRAARGPEGTPRVRDFLGLAEAAGRT